MGAIASLASKRLSVVPGAEASVEVLVRNTGTVVDQLTAGVLGDAAPWAAAEPPFLSLFPGTEGTLRIVFRPPRDASVPAGPLPFGVRIASREDPAGSVVEEGVLDVAPFADVTAELAPRTSRGSRGATHDLAVDNRGNAPLNATISAADPDQLLDFDIKPPSVVAEPGAATFARLAVRPRKRFWRGQPQTRPFRVQVEAPGQMPVGADGTLLQEPLLPPWFLRALAALLALLLALIVIWLFLLRPTIQSAAQERAEQVLESAGIPVGGGVVTPPGGGDPGGGDPGGGGGAPAGGGGGVAVVSTPRDGRIVANGEPARPGQDRTLFVTDLVFSNPGAESGDLLLRRSGETLLVLRLENFRDLDFHFVTPIVVRPDQRLELQCPGCQDAAVYFSGYER
jgi:hypothetical protein